MILYFSRKGPAASGEGNAKRKAQSKSLGPAASGKGKAKRSVANPCDSVLVTGKCEAQSAEQIPAALRVHHYLLKHRVLQVSRKNEELD